MAWWIDTGFLQASIIALTGLEVLGLLVFRRVAGPNLTVAKLLPNILAGDFLLLAWLTNIRHAPWPLPAAALLAALICHLTDLWRRMQR